MTDKGAFLFSQSVAALCEAMGAHAENQQRAICGESPAYDSGAFQDIIDRYKLGYNDAIKGLQF